MSLSKGSRSHWKRNLILALFLIIMTGITSFYSGIDYQSKQDTPLLAVNNSNQNLEVTTLILPTALNVSLSLSPRSLAHAIGKVHVQLGSTGAVNQWVGDHDYDLSPGGWNSYLFTPSLQVSQYDSVTVST